MRVAASINCDSFQIMHMHYNAVAAAASTAADAGRQETRGGAGWCEAKDRRNSVWIIIILLPSRLSFFKQTIIAHDGRSRA